MRDETEWKCKLCVASDIEFDGVELVFSNPSLMVRERVQQDCK